MIISEVLKELKFKAVRSSGAGGQHVNKVSSKVEVTFDILTSEGVTEEEKNLIKEKLASKITKSDLLILSCGDTRSQHRNKELVIKRLLELLEESIQVPKERKATKPTKSSNNKRLDKKKQDSIKKANRKKPLL